MRRQLHYIGLIAALLCGLGSASTLLGQQDEGEPERLSPEERELKQLLQPRIGVFGQFGLNLHSGNFYGLPEAPSCMELDSAGLGGDLGFGLGGGLLFELPLSPQWFLEARVGYSSIGARLESRADLGPTLAITSESDTATVISKHLLDASLGLVGGGVTIGWRPFTVPVTFRLGPDVGIFMQKSYTQQEELVEPSSASFIGPSGENTRIRNTATGDIENTGVQIAGTVAVDYELPLNDDRTLLLVPEVRYSFPFTKVRSDLDWRIHRMRGGIAVKYSFPIPKPLPPVPPGEEPTEPPPPPAQPMLSATVQPVGVGKDGVEREVLKITVEEFINTQTHALLNYVFFDENSSTIPGRYLQYGGDASTQFKFDMLRDQGTMAVYYQMLNIIGSRMKADPGVQITLTGTNSNEGLEKGNRALSKSRAENVKNYLVNNWGIASNRISVKDRNLPSLPSNTEEADGNQENRRVEITANRESLLEPVTTDDTLRTVDPPMIRVKNGYTAEAGIEDWSLQIRQGAKLLKEFDGTGAIPAQLDWDIQGNPLEIPREQTPVVALLSARDEQGQTTSAVARLPVEQITIRRKREERLGDLVYDRFNLITFEYNSAQLSKPSKKIAAGIKERIQPESTVDIVGYSDRLGEEQHNLELSKARAENTARELGVSLERARGGGENTTLYDNNLPEGRFYSRTVDITITTPVKGE